MEVIRESLELAGALGKPTLVALSGGPDSTALLCVMEQIAPAGSLHALHANHQLRGTESEADQQFVTELCRGLRVPLHCRSLPVSAELAPQPSGLEETARNARLDYFREIAAQTRSGVVLTGHTADDQVETVLHRILRGTGLRGLAGIPHCRSLGPGLNLVRPMLGITRAQVLSYLARIGQTFRLDQSNQGGSFTRNRIRNELLPHLRQQFNPQLDQALLNLAATARAAQAALAGPVQELRSRALLVDRPERVALSCRVLAEAPAYAAAELIRELWTERQWPLKAMGQTEFQRILQLAAQRGNAWDLPGGIRAERSGDAVLIERKGAGQQDPITVQSGQDE